ncbi:MAG: hypothetical protein ACRCWJ_18315, partial [Casimicrobium sp.]
VSHVRARNAKTALSRTLALGAGGAIAGSALSTNLFHIDEKLGIENGHAYDMQQLNELRELERESKRESTGGGCSGGFSASDSGDSGGGDGGGGCGGGGCGS